MMISERIGIYEFFMKVEGGLVEYAIQVHDDTPRTAVPREVYLDALATVRTQCMDKLTESLTEVEALGIRADLAAITHHFETNRNSLATAMRDFFLNRQ